MNRRGFIKSLASLAAAAVAVTTAPNAVAALQSLVPSDLDRLMASMRSGLVEKQTFVFYKPITISIDNLVIRHCTLIFKLMEKDRNKPLIIVDSNNLYMHDCLINSDCLVHTAIEIAMEPSYAVA